MKKLQFIIFSAASRVPATVRASKQGYLVDIWLAGIQKSIQKYGGEWKIDPK